MAKDVFLQPDLSLLRFENTDTATSSSVTYGVDGVKISGTDVTNLSRLAVEGTNGILFRVTDVVSGTLLSVLDSIGTSVFYVTSTGNINATGNLYINQIFASGSIYGNQNLILTGSANVGSNLNVTGSAYVNGDIFVTGSIYAREFHTQVVSASIIYQSGSTKFGDTSDDTHQITGSLQVTGTSHYVLGNVGIGAASVGSKLYVAGDAIITSNVGSPTFTSGFAGSGYRITSGSKWSIESDDLTIRGTMRVYELLINQIRATNGSLWVSSVGKVTGVSGVGPYVLTFDTGSGLYHGFAANDLIRAQRIDQTVGFNIYRSDLTVTSITSATVVATLVSGSSVPAVGMEYVRIGNTSELTRQGAVYLTSDDSAAPYIDIIDGINSFATFNTAGTVKTRVGRLSGITATGVGNLSGYGIYASRGYFVQNANNLLYFDGTNFVLKSENATLSGSNVSITAAFLSIVTPTFVVQSSGSTGSGSILMGTAAGAITATTGTGVFVDGTGKMRIGTGTAGTSYLYFDGTDVDLKTGRATISGSSVTIGAPVFDLSATNLKIQSAVNSGQISLNGGTASSNTGSYLDGTGKFNLARDVDNYVRNDGTTFSVRATNAVLSGSNVSITAGTLAITTSTFEVKSALNSGTIKLGSDVANMTAATIGTGVYADGTGVFRVGTSVTGSSYLYFNGTSVDIKTGTATISGSSITIGATNFLLTTGTLVLDSAGSGSMKIGTSAGSITVTAGTGIYADGTGKFRVGTALVGNSYIYFDGSSLQIKSSDLSITTTNFNLTSAGVLSVGSSTSRIVISPGATAATGAIYTGTGVFANANTPFYLDGDGNFSLKNLLSFNGTTLAITGSGSFTGAITASAGSIAGWLVSTSALTGTSSILYSSGVLSLGTGVDDYDRANRIYIDGPNNRLSLGNALTFTGGNLTITGSVFAQNGVFSGSVSASSGTIGGWSLASTEISASKARIRNSGIISLGSDDGYSTVNSIWIDGAANRFSLGTTLTYSAGVLVLTGTITASAGNIAGWILEPSEIRTGDTDIADINSTHIRLRNGASVHNGGNGNYIDSTVKAKGLQLQWYSSGNAGSLIFGEVLTDATGSPIITGFNGWYGIQMMHHTGDTPFQLASKVTGTVVTSSNIIAGWKFDTQSIYTSNARIKSSGVLSLGPTDGYGISGSIYIDGPNNRVSFGDSLTYTGGALTLTGTVTASAGRIGGWDISATEISSSRARLRNTGVLSIGSADGWLTTNSIFIDGPNNRMSLGSTLKFESGSLTITGSIFAQNGVFSGSISASSGKVGGWTIGPNALSATGITLTGGVNASIISNSWTITPTTFTLGGTVVFNTVDGSGWLAGGNIQWDGQGNSLFVGAITASAGLIGGWSLAPTELSSSHARIRKTGIISLGTADGYDTLGSIWIDGATNKFSLGTALTYNAGVLTLTGTVTASAGLIGGWNITSSEISSSRARLRNTGVLSIGSADGWSTADSIYIDGVNNRLSLGSALTFTGGTLTITGSILASSGVFSGSVSASSGTIGGWSLASTELSASSARIRNTGIISLGSADGYSTPNSIWIDGATNRFSLGTALTYSAGVLTLTGVITASTGSIGGWTVETGEIRSGNTDTSGPGNTHLRVRNGASVHNSGGVNYENSIVKAKGIQLQWHTPANAGSLIFGEVLSDAAGNPNANAFNGWYGIQSMDHNGGTPFHLAHKSTGADRITNNFIAGWKFDLTKISSTNAILHSSGVLSLGTGVDDYDRANRIYIDGPQNRISLGNALTFTGGNLTITGSIFAQNGVFSGSVSAASGRIGGWLLATDRLTGGNLKLLSSGYVIDGAGNYNNADTSTFIGGGQFSLKNKLSFDGTNLYVTGSINATSGYFSDAVQIGGRTNVVPEITNLYTFDGHAGDDVTLSNPTGSLTAATTYGYVTGSLSSFTLTPAGKFAGAVAVEIGSSNSVIPLGQQGSGTPPFSTDSVGISSTEISSVKFNQKNVIRWIKTPATDTSNIYIGSSYLSSAVTSTSWTASFYVKRADGRAVTGVGIMYIYSPVASLTVTPTISYSHDGWYRVTGTVTYASATHVTLTGISSLDGTTTWYVAGWQTEPLPYATSYTEVARTYGKLSYATTIASRGTMGMWHQVSTEELTPRIENRYLGGISDDSSNNNVTVFQSFYGQQAGYGLLTSNSAGTLSLLTALSPTSTPFLPTSAIAGEWVYVAARWDSNGLVDDTANKREIIVYQPRTNTVYTAKDASIILPSVSGGRFTIGAAFSHYGIAGGLYDDVFTSNIALNKTVIQGIYMSGAPVRATASTTVVTANGIKTGELQSVNWNGTTMGSLIDLNSGRVHFGGSGSNAKMYFDGTNLFITGSINATSGTFSGTVSASAGTIGGYTIGTNSLFTNPTAGMFVELYTSGSGTPVDSGFRTRFLNGPNNVASGFRTGVSSTVSPADQIAIYAGASAILPMDYSTATFRVKNSGHVTMTTGSIGNNVTIDAMGMAIDATVAAVRWTSGSSTVLTIGVATDSFGGGVTKFETGASGRGFIFDHNVIVAGSLEARGTGSNGNHILIPAGGKIGVDPSDGIGTQLGIVANARLRTPFGIISTAEIVVNGTSPYVELNSTAESAIAEFRATSVTNGMSRLHLSKNVSYGGGLEFWGGAGTTLIPSASRSDVPVNDNLVLYRRYEEATGSTKYIWTARNGITDNNWHFRNDVIVSGSLYALGNVYAYYSSDPRMKDNPVLIKDARSKLRTIGGYNYDWNSLAEAPLVGLNDFGVMADQIEAMAPQLVQVDAHGYKRVDYMKLIPFLINATNEQSDIVDAHEERLSRIEQLLAQK